jgi:hypothetical protein
MKHLLKHHKKIITVRKQARFNPHKYWVVFFTWFMIILIGELGYFMWYFKVTTNKLDEPAVPSVQTNAAIITAMHKSLDATEAAVRERIGDTTSVVQE